MVSRRGTEWARVVRQLSAAVCSVLLVTAVAMAVLVSFGTSAQAHADPPRSAQTGEVSQSAQPWDVTPTVTGLASFCVGSGDLSRECPGEQSDGRCCASVCAAVCHAAADLPKGAGLGPFLLRASLLPDPHQYPGGTTAYDLLRPPRA